MDRQHIILLLANNELARRHLNKLLMTGGYRIYEADNLENGLRLAHDIHPHLIIHDIHQDEIHFAQDLQERMPGLQIPIIGLLSFLDKLESGFAPYQHYTTFLFKPVKADILLQYIAKYLAFKPHLTSDEIIREDETTLKQQLALYHAELQFGASHNLEQAKQFLPTLLNDCGIDKCLFYTFNKNWVVNFAFGYQEKDPAVQRFFGNTSCLQCVVEKKEMYKLNIHNKYDMNVCSKLSINTGLILPILDENQALGVLLIGNENGSINLASDYAFAFAKSLASYLRQILVNSKTQSQNASFKNEDNWLDYIVDLSASCIMLMDEKGIILNSNKKIEDLLGYERDSILGRKLVEFLPDNKIDFFIAAKEQALASVNPILISGCLQHNNGTIRDVEGYMRAIVEKNAFAVTLEDMTESNRLRKQNLLNDKLATMGTLAVGIMHEINNPIAWIMTNLNYLKERFKKFNNNITVQTLTDNHPANLSDLKAEISNYNEVIDECLEGTVQIRDIIKELKGYARVDEQNVELVDVHEIINSAIKIADSQYKNHVKIEKFYEPNIPKGLFARGKLQQVFLNLIVNAAQCIHEREGNNNIIQIRSYAKDNHVYIDITDNGPGIPSEVLPNIFEPFFTTKPAGVGTGLGLAICKEIVTNAEGDLTVTTQLGKGSTFTVSLPLKGATSEKKSVDKGQNDAAVRPAHILVVDDEPTLLKTIQRILENEHSITLAPNGQKAIEILKDKNYSFDIIITDLSMPDVSGIDIYKHIAQQNKGLENHIIFITGGTDSATAKNFLKNVSNLCISKPFTKAELLHAISVAVLTPLN